MVDYMGMTASCSLFSGISHERYVYVDEYGKSSSTGLCLLGGCCRFRLWDTLGRKVVIG